MADPYTQCTFLRSCKKECDKPVDGEVSGEFPQWLKGCLIRIGSGLLEVGPDKYKCVFDGLSLMHRFQFQDGHVSYSNRFLRSDAYNKNIKANRILVTELFTLGVPDPCKTIFQRLSSYFSSREMTDNDLVNVIMYGGEPYASTEGKFLWKIDPVTLENLEKVNISHFVDANALTAHAHEEAGTVYNVGSCHRGSTSFYNICKFPLKDLDSERNCFEQAELVASFPSSRRYSGGYFHSFAITPNYFVLIEQPLYFSLIEYMKCRLLNRSPGDAFIYDNNAQARFRVIRRSDGQEIDTQYVSDCFYLFHHVNAYESDDHNLVIDVCAYLSGELLKVLYVSSLEQLYKDTEAPPVPFQTDLRRYVIPIMDDAANSKVGDSNLVTMASTTASAHKKADGSIFLVHEKLNDYSDWNPELPRINYEKCNGKSYKYIYSIATKSSRKGTCLAKLDVQLKKSLMWYEEGVVPSEPIFVADPNAQDEEDSGIILASLLYEEDDKKVSLLALNASDFKEIGRVTFQTEGSVPNTFHGVFIPK